MGKDKAKKTDTDGTRLDRKPHLHCEVIKVQLKIGAFSEH